MRNHQMLKPTLPTDKRTSPRSQILTSSPSKRSPRIPKIASSPSALEEQITETPSQLVLSPLQSNKRGGRSARGPPTIFRPKFESNSPMTSRNQKKPKEKAPARTPRCESILDIKSNPKLEKYVPDIERIEKLKNKLVTRHAENENYYQKHYSSFLRILNEALISNPSKVPIVVQNTKMFFEGLLQNLIGKRGKLDKANFDFEGTLRSIITSPNSTINDQNDADSNENVFKDLFDEKGKPSGRRNNNEIDLSNLGKYESDIQVIKNLMQKLIDRHPENERYYRKHYESFLRILSETVSSNKKKAPIVIKNTKMFFEGLLNGLLGRNGKLKTTSFDFEEKLRKVAQNDDDNDDEDQNIIDELIKEDNEKKNDANDDQENLQDYINEINEINNLVKQLIEKHPENEDYYRDLFDSFMKVLNDSVKNNNEKAPSIIQNAKVFFEGLLNDLFGENGKIDDSEFNFEERLRNILSHEEDDENDNNENVFEDLLNKKDQTNLQQYEAEIKEIEDLMQQLIEKHPENEDYYRDLFDSFMKVLNESIKTNNEKAPSIIQNAKTFFEGLLNDLIGENGRIDDSEFNFEERLRNILSHEEEENENDTDENVFKDLFDKKEQEKLQQYEAEIKEIEDLMNQLIEKHPENEGYYRDLFDSFMKVLNESIKTNNEKAPSIIQNAKTFFEGLLNDQIGENGKIDDSEFNFEERLRNILSQDEEENENENIFQDLFDKKEQEKLQQYESEIKEINDLVQQLIEKHPENEDYYRNLFDSFMKVLNESIKTNNEKAPSIIQNAKTFFEGLLNDQIGENGRIDDSEFNFEERLRNILSQDEEENENENIFQDLFDKKEQEKLQQYESEIKEINDLVQQLIEKHPENEDYYRDLYDSFMKVLRDAIDTNNEKAPVIIKNAKTFFEGLLNDQIGENGKIDDSEFNFEERLRNILSQEEDEENNTNENVFEDLFDKKEQEKLQQYESEIKEINDLVQQLIEKHPENEDYYRNLYDSFMKVLNESIKTNSEKAPSIIQNAKTFFEGLLNDQIGENGRIDDSEFNFEERLRNILSQEEEENENDTDENVFKDLFDKKEQEKLQQYESEIKEINDLVQQLIEKHPENEDYYRDLYDSFMKILNESIKTNSEKAPSIIQNAKTFFEGLLNDQIGENGRIDDSEFNFEERLRNILSQEEEDANENVFEDLLKKEDQSNIQQYEAELKEINDLVQQLIEKHPDNEEYFRMRHDAFLRVLNVTVKEDSENVPKLIQETKEFFQKLLEDDSTENRENLSKTAKSTKDGLDETDFNFTSSGLYKIPALAEDPEYDEEDQNKNKSKSSSILHALNEDDQGGTKAENNEENEQSVLNKYENEIGEIKNMVQDLIEKHPENEDYYKKLYESFMKVVKEAAEANSPVADEIIEAAKTIFEDLLNGEQEQLDYNLEDKLREILSKSETNENENKNENENENSEEKDQSVLNKYESEIGEIKNIVQDLIDKHPENEDYYRKLYESFMKVVKEAAEANSPVAGEIIEAAKTIFKDLYEGDQEQLDYNLEDKLREILSKSESNENENKDENSEENEQSNLAKYENEIGEIQNMMQDLIDKHPENEDYYRKLYESFMKVVKEAAEAGSPAAPEIIEAAKTIFEDLLNGEQEQLDFDFEDKLREILSKSESNENENKDENENEDEQNDKRKNESEMDEIQILLHKLIDKYPENQDFYQKLYDSFTIIIRQASEANSPQVPGIIRATKLFFEELLNGEHAKIDFNIGEKLREILMMVNNVPMNSNENENENKKDETENNNNDDDNNNESIEENEQSVLNNYKSEIGEIKNMVQDLIDKHPENEDYYRKLYESFMKVIKEAEESGNPAAPEIIEAAKTIFEDLLNGEQEQLDFDFEDKLREILSKSETNENENENENDQSNLTNYENEIGEIKNIVEDLIDKHPENEDYYRKLYESFMKVIKEAAETGNPVAGEIIEAAKTIFKDLYEGDQERLDFELEDKLREILSTSPDSIYKPYKEIDNDDEYTSQNNKSPNFEKLYPATQITPNSKKRYSTVPNYQTIICALRFTCLPGPRFTKLVENISTTMKENKDERFVLLMASRTQKFKGIYILSEDALSAKKMWGEGPNEIKSEDVGAFSKYITNQKIFEPLQIRGFTQTTDAFSLKKKAEPDLW